MNKKDVLKLALFDITLLLLLVEHLVLKLEVAFPILIIWTIITLVANIVILKDYAITITCEEV